MPTRPEFEPPPLDPERVARLTSLAEEVITAIDAKRPTREPIARFNDDAGTRLTRFDFHSAASRERPRDFVERVLTRVPTLADLRDDEAVTLVQRLQSTEGSARERYYWIELLAKGLGQPGMADLVEHPDGQYGPGEVVAIARTCVGSALARYLDPLWRGYHIARALLRHLISKRQLALREGASIEDLARGAAQFLDRGRVSNRSAAAMAAWLVEQPMVEELFADDDAMERALTQV